MQSLYKSVNFKCIHCGKSYEDHKTLTLNCPRKARGHLKGFDRSHTYAPNYDKPEVE